MLIKAFSFQGATDADYKKVLNNRLLLLGILFVLGIITVVISLVVTFKGNSHTTDFLKGLYLGVGLGLSVTSIMFIIRIRLTLKDEKKIKQKRIEEHDERNQMIVQKAFYNGSLIVMFIMYLALLIAGIFNIVVFWTLFVIGFVNCLVFISAYIYFNKKM